MPLLYWNRLERKNMVKKLFGLLLLLPVLVPLPVWAAQKRVQDGAGLFSSSEIEKLNQKAEELSAQYDTEIFVLTGNQDGFSDNFARDVIEQYGTENYPDGYIGYMVNMADRSYWVDAYGSKEREIFTQNKTDDLSELAFASLQDGEYYDAAADVLQEIGNQFELAAPMGWLKKPLLYPMKSLLFGGISTAAALAIAWVMTALKSARHKDKAVSHTAAEYGKDFALTAQHNQFVRHYQTQVPKPKPQQSSGGGFSGGGGSVGHTGSGGHF